MTNLFTNITPGLINPPVFPSLSPINAFNIQQIQNLIDTKGIIAYIYKSSYIPDRGSLQAGYNLNNENKCGVQYYSVRPIKLVPYNLPLDQQFQVDGIYGQSSVILNVAGNYFDNPDERLICKPRDVIIIPNVLVLVQQLLECPATMILNTKYKVRDVEYIASKNTIFIKDQDFIITEDFKIKFLEDGNKPNTKEVLVVIYMINPIYIIKSLGHNLRILEDSDTITSIRKFKYFPQLVIASQSHLEPNDKIDFSTLPEINEG